MQVYPDKDPGDRLPYSMVFKKEDNTPFEISTGTTVEVEIGSDGAAPTLVVSNISVIASVDGGVLDSVVFWLSGGDDGVRYLLKASDPSSSSLDPALIRRASISVARQ